MKSINIQAFDSFYQSTVVNNDNFSIIDSIVRSFPYFHTTISGLLPLWIVVIVIFAIGWLAAKILRSLIAKRLKEAKFDHLSEKIKLDEPLSKLGVKKGLSHLIGQIVFWIIMMLITVSASDKIGIEIISEQIRKIIDFIPKAISATLILLAGYFLATKIKEVITNVTASVGKTAGSILGSIIYWFIMIMVIITALDQTGIDTELISNNIILIVGIMLLAGSIAYAYAAKDIMSNMLSSFFGKKNFKVGQNIKVKDIEGVIETIDNTSVTVNTGKSRIVIPAREMVNNPVEIFDHD